jgi:hypothetical protein
LRGKRDSFSTLGETEHCGIVINTTSSQALELKTVLDDSVLSFQLNRITKGCYQQGTSVRGGKQISGHHDFCKRLCPREGPAGLALSPFVIDGTLYLEWVREKL